MDEDRETRIRHRAYHIWIEEGCPEGRHHEHWLRAEHEVASTDAASCSGDAATALPSEAGEPPAATGAEPPVATQAAPRRRGRTAAAAAGEPADQVNGAETLTPAPDEAQPAPKPARRGRRTAEVDPG